MSPGNTVSTPGTGVTDDQPDAASVVREAAGKRSTRMWCRPPRVSAASRSTPAGPKPKAGAQPDAGAQPERHQPQQPLAERTHPREVGLPGSAVLRTGLPVTRSGPRNVANPLVSVPSRRLP